MGQAGLKDCKRHISTLASFKVEFWEICAYVSSFMKTPELKNFETSISILAIADAAAGRQP